MPLPVENLTKDSDMNAIREAINQSYKVCMDEPRQSGETIAQQQKRCGGMIYNIARERTGKPLKG